MTLTIDNLDGLGALDYTGAIEHSARVAPAAVKRVLNAPSSFRATLCLAGTTLRVPVRRARVSVASDGGTTLFTGYLTTEPSAVYAGMASAGPVYRLLLHALSDEWLLDQAAGSMVAGAAYGASGGAALRALLARTGVGHAVNAAVAPGTRALGVFAPGAAAVFSAHAGALASASFAAYRVLDGSLTLGQVPGAQHALSESDGSFEPAGLLLANVRELANDVTVSGATEAGCYWTEVFTGDGSTVAFPLAGAPADADGGHGQLIDDSFGGESLDLATWSVTDAGEHLALGANGLALSGGNGLDGQTALVANTPVELAGTLVLELGSVQLGAGSAGLVGAFYNGAVLAPNCFAGFQVTQSGGQTVLSAFEEGDAAGTAVNLAQGHSYTLRVRLHCPELQRVRQVFYGLDEGGAVAEFGGGLLDAPAALVLEVRDEEESSNTPVTVLYDGSVALSPAVLQLAVTNALQLFGSVGSARLRRTGSAWVQLTDANTGATRTGLTGGANDGIDCQVTSSAAGALTFYAGRVPAAGERILVAYRGRARAVGRVADGASVAAEAAGGAPGTERWLGRVTAPPARSSEDCENAALAIVSAAASRAAAAAGTYTAVYTQGGPPGGDIWPGDTLALTTDSGSLGVIVRKVEVEDRGAAPEALTYRIAFANDWAEELGLRLSDTIAPDASLPASALDLVPAAAAGDVPAVPVHVLASLADMLVAGVSTTAIQVDAGLAPPAGGGFEVRRRDGGFGSGLGNAGTGAVAGDLVLRSPVRGFAIPRGALEERFYIRMYDGSTPPLYSRFSSAIVTHVPVG